MRFRAIIVVLVLLATLLACSLPALPFFETQPTPAGTIRPKFVNHPKPALKMDFKPFLDAGCKPDAEGIVRCPPNLPPFDRFGCFEITQAADLLGGLRPPAALMICTLESQPDTEVDRGAYVYSEGCLLPVYLRYLAYRDGQFQLINNLAELKKFFAPIESVEEALSYALAATGFQAMYGLKDENYRYLADQVEDTYILPGANGYAVLLYSYQLCGCGPHPMSRRLVNLTLAGDLDVNDPQPIWEDPAQDGLCVD